MSTAKVLQHSLFLFGNAGAVDKFKESGVPTNHKDVLCVAFDKHKKIGHFSFSLDDVLRVCTHADG